MIKLVHITDSHLGAKPGDRLLSMNPDESLMDVLALVKAEQTEIDWVLATGDIASASYLSAYRRFKSMVSNHLTTPIAWLPGNHDDHRIMEEVIPNSKHRRIISDYWLIILLDSHVPGKVYGNFAPSELDYLSQALRENPDKHVLITFHHQPVPIGSAWMDRYIIQNASTFWDLISTNRQVRCVLWGHVHQEYDRVKGNIRLLSTPSTCIQFAPNQLEFKVSKEMPGYRWMELHDDGHIETAVSRVSQKDYGIDYHSRGY